MSQWSQQQREAIVHAHVRGFAAAGWIAGAMDTKNGVKWWWYQKGSDYVICARQLTGDKFLDDVADPNFTMQFSPADVERICMGAPSSSRSPSAP